METQNKWTERRQAIARVGIASALTVLFVARITPECSWDIAVNIALVTAGGMSMLAGCVCAVPELHEKHRQENL